MLIINISAILTLLAALLIGAMVFAALPDLGEDARLVAGGLVLFGTSLIAELVGLAPRIFIFIPLWLVAVATIGLKVHERHGVLGALGLGVGALVLLVLMILVGRAHERRRERKELARRLAELDLRGLNPAYDQAWDTLHEALLSPSVTPWSRELLEHQHRVAVMVQRWVGDGIPEPRLLERAVRAFAEGAADPAKVDADNLRYQTSWLQSVIRSRDALAKKAAALRAMQAESR